MSVREELGKLCREVILRCELNHLSADKSADEFAGVISAREEEFVAAARAQALEEAAKLTEGFKHYYSTLDSQGMTSVREDVYANTVSVAREIRALITPSDSTALAKLLALEPERLDELAEHITYKIQSLLTDKYTNSFRIAHGIIRQELAARVAELKGKKGMKS